MNPVCNDCAVLYDTPLKMAVIIGGTSIKIALITISLLSFLQILPGVNGLAKFGMTLGSFLVLPVTFFIIKNLSGPTTLNSSSNGTQTPTATTPFSPTTLPQKFEVQKQTRKYYTTKPPKVKVQIEVTEKNEHPLLKLPSAVLKNVFKFLSIPEQISVSQVYKNPEHKWNKSLNAQEVLFHNAINEAYLVIQGLPDVREKISALCSLAKAVKEIDQFAAKKYLHEAESLFIKNNSEPQSCGFSIESLKIKLMTGKEEKEQALLVKRSSLTNETDPDQNIRFHVALAMTSINAELAQIWAEDLPLKFQAYIHLTLAKRDVKYYKSAVQKITALPDNSEDDKNNKNKWLGVIALISITHANFDLFNEGEEKLNGPKILNEAGSFIAQISSEETQKLVWNQVAAGIVERAAEVCKVKLGCSNSKQAITSNLEAFLDRVIEKVPKPCIKELFFLMAKMMLQHLPQEAKVFAVRYLKDKDHDLYLRFLMIKDALVFSGVEGEELSSIDACKSDQDRYIVFKSLFRWNGAAARLLAEKFILKKYKFSAYCELACIDSKYRAKALALIAQLPLKLKVDRLHFLYEKLGENHHCASQKIVTDLKKNKAETDKAKEYNLKIYEAILEQEFEPSTRRSLLLQATQIAATVKDQNLMAAWVEKLAVWKENRKINEENNPVKDLQIFSSYANKSDDDHFIAKFLIEHANQQMRVRFAFNKFISLIKNDYKNEFTDDSKIEFYLDCSKILKKSIKTK